MTAKNLYHKTCPTCDRPFSWRKKWQNCWDEVVHCSSVAGVIGIAQVTATKRDYASLDE